jgi:hypothetical protein
MPEPETVVEQALWSTAAAESADSVETFPYLPEPVRQESMEVGSPNRVRTLFTSARNEADRVGLT